VFFSPHQNEYFKTTGIMYGQFVNETLEEKEVLCKDAILIF